MSSEARLSAPLGTPPPRDADHLRCLFDGHRELALSHIDLQFVQQVHSDLKQPTDAPFSLRVGTSHRFDVAGDGRPRSRDQPGRDRDRRSQIRDEELHIREAATNSREAVRHLHQHLIRFRDEHRRKPGHPARRSAHPGNRPPHPDFASRHPGNVKPRSQSARFASSGDDVWCELRHLPSTFREERRSRG